MVSKNYHSHPLLANCDCEIGTRKVQKRKHTLFGIRTRLILRVPVVRNPKTMKLSTFPGRIDHVVSLDSVLLQIAKMLSSFASHLAFLTGNRGCYTTDKLFSRLFFCSIWRSLFRTATNDTTHAHRFLNLTGTLTHPRAVPRH